MTDQPQHIKALTRANEVRLSRAALKRKIEQGKVKVSDVVKDMPWCMESIALGELLRSQRRWGGMRASKFLNGLTLREGKQLQDLTNRQRRLLRDALQERNL